MIGETFSVRLKGNSGVNGEHAGGADGQRDSNQEKTAFFSHDGPYGSATNLEKYRESGKHNLAAISERHMSEDESVGLRARRFASVDDSYTRTDLGLESTRDLTPPARPTGFWSWFGGGSSNDDDSESLTADNGDGGNSMRSKSEGSMQSAASQRLMRQITMENVLEGVDNTPLSSKLSLSLYRTDTDTFSPRNSTIFSEIAASTTGTPSADADNQEESNFLSAFFLTGSSAKTKASASTPESSPKKQMEQRTVTFRSKDSYDEDELSYLVETLSRSESTSFSSRRRSSNYSVSGTMGLDEIPYNHVTPSKKQSKVSGIWRSVKGAFSSPVSQQRSGSTGEPPISTSSDALATPTRPSSSQSAKPRLQSSPGSSQSQRDSGMSKDDSSAGTSPGAALEHRLSTSCFTHNSPPRSSLLLESEREARTMVDMLFGFSDNSPRRSRSAKGHSGMGAGVGGGAGANPRLSQSAKGGIASAGARRASVRQSEAGVGDDVLVGKEHHIELKVLSPASQRMHYSLRGAGAGAGGSSGSLYRASSLRSSGSDSVGHNSHSKHSSHDSLYNLFFHAPGGVGHQRDSDNTSDWGPVPSARSSFASHYTESSADGYSHTHGPSHSHSHRSSSTRARSGSSASSASRDSEPDASAASLLRAVEGGVQRYSASLLAYSRGIFASPGDEIFLEFIRVQPFATGGYMRGMLVCGFCTLFFHIYTLALWPDLSLAPSVLHSGSFGVFLSVAFGVSAPQYVSTVESFLYSWFVLLTVLNILQLPSRIVLHLWSWKCSRAVEVDAALTLVRAMVCSDIWLLNRMLGRVMDLASLLSLLVGEVFLWSSVPEDPLRSLVVSLCSTCLLAFIVRVGIATTFAISMHDPTVLAEARRRGLSKWDFTKLPSFVFTDFKEVTNKDCSICLGTFDLGEMVTLLPCDQKHSFHSPCIRAWLERQNSCPLCMKMV